MNSEWPVRADAPQVPARPRRTAPRPDASARRLADAGADLFLSPANRLSDRLRASASAMLDDLVDGVDREMRAHLSPYIANEAEGGASFGAPSGPIARPLLRDTRLLAEPGLIELVMRRAETFILADRLAPMRDGSGLPIDDGDGEIAACATALLVAEARRVDRFGAPALLFDDLTAELAHWLVWHVAAALRHHLCRRQEVDDAVADALLTQAAFALFGAHDEGRGLDAIAARLAAGLHARGRIDGRLLAGWLEAGQVAAFAAALAVAAGIPGNEAWHIVADPADVRLSLLLRAAGVAREPAAAILLMLLPQAAEAAAAIDRYDLWSEPDAVDALAPLAVDPAFRAAVRALETALAADVLP